MEDPSENPDFINGIDELTEMFTEFLEKREEEINEITKEILLKTGYKVDIAMVYTWNPAEPDDIEAVTTEKNNVLPKEFDQKDIQLLKEMNITLEDEDPARPVPDKEPGQINANKKTSPSKMPEINLSELVSQLSIKKRAGLISLINADPILKKYEIKFNKNSVAINNNFAFLNELQRIIDLAKQDTEPRQSVKIILSTFLAQLGLNSG
ncbi:MAG: hypothetical protein Q8Q06_01755 [bacterium]|nr:hypothetical protein [bacterium]